MSKKTSEAEKGAMLERIAQLESFASEMKDFEPTLPHDHVRKSYVIREKDHAPHLQFHGLGHTAGDVVVFCPQKRVIVTGDLRNPHFPEFIDSYQRGRAPFSKSKSIYQRGEPRTRKTALFNKIGTGSEPSKVALAGTFGMRHNDRHLHYAPP